MVFPYKEEVTGSNPVAPTRVFQKSLHIYSQKPHKLKIEYCHTIKLPLNNERIRNF